MDFSRAAIQAVKLTLLDSGADNEQVQNLFGRVALGEDFLFPEPREWNAELNKRRFELIDMDIQRTLSHAEQLELGVLTQLMRDYVDSYRRSCKETRCHIVSAIDRVSRRLAKP